ncbi:DUF5686 and carboxypeptidase-like regulatory domain-containing protein [Pontibacter vulgaris]|uniref:DUF5686 and carboxypeptidase-like regulatory domain-containing protein n=1 Tax=Pontibacter vulgaris TaxID=2905679 RepID=UPI001FA78CD3|nr:DUF5686 and carboxypeptidase-like regulatory domain-containing protein [Pontibacter vulgaris]
MRPLLTLFFCLLSIAIPLLAQVYTLRGTVRDAQTNEKLAFVNIAVNDGETGTTTNLDGQYQLRHNRPVKSVRFSYVGYAPQIVYPDSVETININLQPAAARLTEVIVRSGTNPAHRIIRLAHQNREHNSTENLPAYTYRTYNKFILTATDAQEYELSDTLQLSKQDSAYLKMRDLLAKQYLFLMESVTDYAYLRPNQAKETILATRVSGLQQPSFGVVAAEAREFSVYADMPVFFGKRYLSPLSTGSIRKYDFLLEETSVVGPDTVYIISFKPLRGKNFDGLKGLLYINSNGWAVQNVIAESAARDDKRGLKLEQQFELVNGKQWFPKELNVEITVQHLLLRGHQPYGILRTYITNVNLNPGLRSRDFSIIALKQNADAGRQQDSFWQQQRPDTLTTIEQRTYQRLDSVGRKQKLDRTIRTIEYLVAKQIPLGPLSLDINRLFRVSRFEGTRLGIGAHTNDRLSERFSIGGYWGYGLRDEKKKYGADVSVVLHKPSDLKLAAEHFEDVLEPGGRRLPFKLRSLLSDLRPAVLDNLDYTTHNSASLSGRVFRYMQVQTILRQEQRRPTLLTTTQESIAQPEFNITEAGIGLRYAYGEQLMQQFNQVMPVASTYPVLWLQYTRGIDGLLNGAYSYSKYDARLEASVSHRSFGETSLTLAGGLIEGAAPFVSLYNGYGSYSSTYTVYTSDGFETMRPYEFLSDRYAAIFFKQNFGKRLLKTGFFKPDLVAITNIGFGDLKQQQQELPVNFANMRKGFYESGLMLNNVISSAFSGIGVGAFYRYGPYAFDKASDNLIFKLTLSLAF